MFKLTYSREVFLIVYRIVREIGKVISREGSILRVNSSLTPKLGDSIRLMGSV